MILLPVPYLISWDVTILEGYENVHRQNHQGRQHLSDQFYHTEILHKIFPISDPSPDKKKE